MGEDLRVIPARQMPLTPEACRAVGGHCWDERRMNPAWTELPTTGGRTHYQEWCKHCPATRTGVSQEPIKWTVTE